MKSPKRATDQPSRGRTNGGGGGGGGGGHFKGTESMAEHLLLVDLLVQPLDHWAHREEGRQLKEIKNS